MTADLDRCLREQQACRAYLDGDGKDREGAWMGLCDWLLEECIIRLEAMRENRPLEDGSGISA